MSVAKYDRNFSLQLFMYDSNTDSSKMKKPILALVSRASIGISAL